jgi:phosphoglycolate phosphatase
MNYPYILIDLDGTVTDPYVGITKSVQSALALYGINESCESLRKLIGPPLHLSFQEVYGFSPEKSMEVLARYREFYSAGGMYDCKLYPGVEDLLEELNKNGHKIMLATSKPTEFAVKILDYFSITPLFHFISGSGLDGTMSEKAEVISAAMLQFPDAEKKDFLMVGDREFDVAGAKKNGIECVGVLYGYGTLEELERAGVRIVISHPSELLPLLK